MFSNISLIKFITAYHHPFQNAARTGYWDQDILEIDIVNEETGEPATITVPQGPKYWVTGGLKMVRMHLPGGLSCSYCAPPEASPDPSPPVAAVAPARELLSGLGPPQVAGHMWTWSPAFEEGRPGKLQNRQQVANVMGITWEHLVFDSLPGRPESYISEQLFQDTAVIKMNTLSQQFSFACERDRYLNGHLVTMRGASVLLGLLVGPRSLGHLLTCCTLIQLPASHFPQQTSRCMTMKARSCRG
jgi:hypothetical protein